MAGHKAREDDLFELLYDLRQPEELRRVQLVHRLTLRGYKIILDVPGKVVALTPRPPFKFGRFLYLFLLAVFPAFFYLLRYVSQKPEEKTFILHQR